MFGLFKSKKVKEAEMAEITAYLDRTYPERRYPKLGTHILDLIGFDFNPVKYVYFKGSPGLRVGWRKGGEGLCFERYTVDKTSYGLEPRKSTWVANDSYERGYVDCELFQIQMCLNKDGVLTASFLGEPTLEPQPLDNL